MLLLQFCKGTQFKSGYIYFIGKEALRQIQKQLIANYGLDNQDVRYLLNLFRYSV